MALFFRHGGQIAFPAIRGQAAFLVIFHAALKLMGRVVAAATFAAKLGNHRFTMRIAVTFLTGRQFTVLWMAERTSLVGVSGFALHQGIKDLCVTTATDFLRFRDAEGDVQRVMGVGVATQAVFILELGPVAFLIVALEAGWNLAMNIMTGGAGDFGIVFGVGFGQSLENLGMALVFVAGAAVFLWRILSVLNDHGIMRASMAGHADLGLNPE